nr:hypothetical protein [Salinisphaera halophila]
MPRIISPQTIGMPDDEAGIGTGDQQAVIHALDTAGEFTRENRAHDQADAPVEPGDHQRHEADRDHRAYRRAGDGGDTRDQAHEQRRLGDGEAGDQHQRHLHGKAEQVPEAVLPEAEHRDRAVALKDHARGEHHQRDDEYQDQWIGQIAVEYADTAAGECTEHGGIPLPEPSGSLSIENQVWCAS